MFSFLKESRGASAIEYAFIVAFVVLAIVGILPLIGSNIAGRFQAVIDSF